MKDRRNYKNGGTIRLKGTQNVRYKYVCTQSSDRTIWFATTRSLMKPIKRQKPSGNSSAIKIDAKINTGNIRSMSNKYPDCCNCNEDHTQVKPFDTD